MSKNIDLTCNINIGYGNTRIYYIKILKKGKDIYIKEQIEFGNTKTPITDCLIINDNIEIPEKIINIFEELFKKVPYQEGGFSVMQTYIELLKNCKVDLGTTYKEKELEENKQFKLRIEELKKDNIQINIKNLEIKKENIEIKKENANLKDEVFRKYFNNSLLKEENEKLKLQTEELKKENETLTLQIKETNKQFKLKIEELKKENEQLKLQIKETKINHIINYYC